MGYGKSSQKTKGIHTRLYSRAFIFEESGYRNVFVSVDCAMMGQLVKKKVIEIIFTILSVIWLKDHYVSSNSIPNGGKNVMLGIGT